MVRDPDRGPLQIAGRSARRIAVALVGTVLIVIGIALLVLPGPGLAVIVAGLAVLSTEFSWARRRLRWVRNRFMDATQDIRARWADRSVTQRNKDGFDQPPRRMDR